MARLPLTFACGSYDRMFSLVTGEVQPDGIDLNFVPIDNPRELFDRMVGGLEFDASEMSSSEYVTRFVAGQCPFVALPVFASRVFRHGFIAVDNRVIRTPKDLEGKRVGVQLYSMTAAIWIRGLLQHAHGVDLSTIQWVEGAMETPTPHGKPTVLPPLKPVKIVQNTSGRSLSQPPLRRRHPGDHRRRPARPASAPSRTSAACSRISARSRRRTTARTGIFPIMHLIVLRRDVYEKHPFVATSLYNALCESKARALRAACAISARCATCCRGCRPSSTRSGEVFGGDPWPYGIEPNRRTLEALVQYLEDQSLIAQHGAGRRPVRAGLQPGAPEDSRRLSLCRCGGKFSNDLSGQVGNGHDEMQRILLPRAVRLRSTAATRPS